MKKIIIFALALMGATSLMAGDYTHSIGAVVGGMNGFSYKGFITDNLAIQADLGVGLTATRGITQIETVKFDGEKDTEKFTEKECTYSIWDFVVNPNLVYQAPIGSGFSLFAGGGISLGMGDMFAVEYKGKRHKIDFDSDDLMGKFGINAMLGAEYKFNGAPVVLGLDFRPGYGMGFDVDKEGDATISTTTHYFDWKLALAVRYCF